MSPSTEIAGAVTLAFALACGAAPAPASSEPAAAAAPVVPDAAAPPMYKPSSNSAAPMPITDPAYGAFSGAPQAPSLGATIPDFEVALADGGTFSLEPARRAGPVLVFFYRGFW